MSTTRDKESETTWHITIRTYGTRLPGDDEATNKTASPDINGKLTRLQSSQARLRSPPVLLSRRLRRDIESAIPDLCHQGGWKLLTCAAASTHLHILCTAPTKSSGATIRTLLKRWLTQRLNDLTPDAPQRWWAEGGSNRPVHSDAHRVTAHTYIQRQRTK